MEHGSDFTETPKRDTFTRLAHAEQTLTIARHGLSLMEPLFIKSDEVSFAAATLSGTMPERLAQTLHEARLQQIGGFRILLTFAVAATLGLQSLRGTESRFGDWWAAKSAEMDSDPLCKRFWALRARVAHQGYVDFFEYRFNFDATDQGVEGSTTLSLRDAPRTFRGDNLDTSDAYALAAMYLAWIDEIFDEAWDEFAAGTRRTEMIPSVREELRATKKAPEPHSEE